MDAFTLTIEILLLLFATAIIASFIDTLAGGGGLLTVPALMLTGMPPIVALGTNKLQGFVGTGTATLVLLLKGQIKWRDIYPIMIKALLGSVAGAIAVQFINTEYLQWIIPITIAAIAIYLLLQKNMHQPKEPAISNSLYSNSVVPLIGAYDGMFGPGTGTLFMASAVALRGQSIIAATMRAKPLNFATNIAAVVVFVYSGNVIWQAGLSMLVGQIIGAWIGSHYLTLINPNVLKKIVVGMCILMLITYLVKSLI